MDRCYQAKTKGELETILKRLGLVGLSIKGIDTYGVIEDIAPNKMRVTEHRYGFCTDFPMVLKMSDSRTISINTLSFKDTYEGFSIAVNPDYSEYKNHRDNNLNVAKYCKECLEKKIIGYEVTKYGKNIPSGIQDTSSESSKELIIKLEDGTKMIFSHWLMAEYMDFNVELPGKNVKDIQTTLGGKMTDKEIFEWAKKNNLIPSDLFTKVTKVGEIDEGEVFALDSDGEIEEPLIIGLPSFIIVNGNNIKSVYGEEAFKVMDKLYPEDNHER